MKKSKLIHSLLLLLFISIFISCNDDSPMDNSTKINVTTPGTLKDVLGFDYLSMTKLTIQGTINGDDINTIRNITGLTHLDIKDVFIIEGGNYLGYNPHNIKDVIPAEMFSNMTKLQVVILPKTVVSIKHSAFLNYTDLQAVTIPNYLKTIEYSAFSGCTNLTKINLPSNITFIGNNAFKDCVGLTSITLPDNLESIEAGTFNGCKTLKSITIPKNITSIKDDSFKDCENLVSINIPNGIDVINSGTFNGCKGLTSVEIPSSVKHIREYAFNNCTSLNSIALTNVVSIGEAFTSCTGLKTINIGPNVVSIHPDAFNGAVNIEEYHIQVKKPQDYYGYPFFPGIGADIKKSATLFIPKGSAELYQNYKYELWSGFKDYIEKY